MEQYTQTLSNEIVGLEKKYWQAMKDHDFEAAAGLTDFPCIVAGEHGAMSVDKDKFKEMFESHKAEEIKDFQFIDEPQLRLISPGVAVLAYKIDCVTLKDGIEKHAAYVDTSTWVQRNHRWVCAMHSEATVH